MEQLRIQTIVLTAALLCAFSVTTTAQTATVISQPANLKEKAIPDAAGSTPFSPNSLSRGPAQSIEFRSVEQMTERDRELAANAESSIGERAKYVGLEFNQGKWSYEQVVCPALPNHIFLRFKRNNGTGDMSMFTASIPRGEDGRVRIIPIQLRGYSLFSPAPINALTISAFNHIRAEENPDKTPVADWLGTGLCYGALAGGQPGAPVPAANPENEKFPAALTGSLEMQNSGGAVISFADVSAVPRPMEWTMTFDSKGRLLRASHMPMPQNSGVVAPHPIRVDQQNKPTPIEDSTLVTGPVPPAPGEQTEHPVAPSPIVQTPISASTINPDQPADHPAPQAGEFH
jgi:hypothetical protein